jgi:hypothetical protein
MLTMNITNNSGADIVAGDGVLPRQLDWVSVANAANVDVVIQVMDLDVVEDYHSGFTMGDHLQQLVQEGRVALTFTDIGATDRSVEDEAIATAA